MTNNFLPQTFVPFSIGMDRAFDQLERLASNQLTSVKYPPYNIVENKENDTFTIEMALAGFSKDEVLCAYYNGVLTIKSLDTVETVNESLNYIHRGLSKRKFSKEFQLSDDVEISEVTMSDGMLYVQLTRIIPENKRRRTLEIL
jgi:molecular chaperone IbpA